MRSKRVATATIRESMSALGFPVDDLSDDEIEQGAVAFAEVAASCGITAQEAVDALSMIGRGGVAMSPE
jgi:hypothetical protein